MQLLWPLLLKSNPVRPRISLSPNFGKRFWQMIFWENLKRESFISNRQGHGMRG